MGGVPSVELSFLMSTISWRGEGDDGDIDDNGDDGDNYDNVDNSDKGDNCEQDDNGDNDKNYDDENMFKGGSAHIAVEILRTASQFLESSLPFSFFQLVCSSL